jgi:hypothetical protein
MPDTRHLKSIIAEVEQTSAFFDRADDTLRRWEHEPLMDGQYETPQSADHHAEGLTLRHHLRRMLAFLYALTDGQLHLNEIEEFARLKGYEGEIQEMEETITENAATFEVFALIHDVGKQFRVDVDDRGSIHYFSHEKDVYRPDTQVLLAKMKMAYRLTDRDVELLIPLISQHMEPLRRFRHAHDPKHIALLSAYATDQGQDTDDFLDALQAAVLLDQVFGSWQIKHEKHVIDPQHLINFLIAEHEYAPWKREQREKQLMLLRQQQQNRIFREVGLDGGGLMQLTGMRPSRELGALLKQVQGSVKDGGGLGQVGASFKKELERRVELARSRLAGV